MKKKVKLFSTIASLCLAVALMAFGVWAATTAQFGISGKVTFTATQNVKATVAGVANVGGDNTQFKAEKAPATPETVTLVGNEANPYTNNTIAFGDAVEIEAKDATKEIYYYYTITITNTAKATDSYPVLVVTMNTVKKAGAYDTDYYEIKTVKGAEYTGTEEVVTEPAYKVEAGQTFVYSVVIKVNPAKSLAATDLATGFTLSVEAQA